jgi:uncharacterized protein YprB with RNaseH-like and TPR domain
MNLADRLQDVLGHPRRHEAVASPPYSRPAHDSVEDALGGAWVEHGGDRVFMVERRWAAGSRHGDVRVGDMTDRLSREGLAASLLTGQAAPVHAGGSPFLFFDLETTGLSGGAGTFAFLIGCGQCEPDGAFATRQYLLVDHRAERAMLDALARELSRSATLVSFNGKSFDALVIETRCLFHRLEWAGADVPHLDVLHPARRFWAGEDCSLIALESQVLRASRLDDVPGFDIPRRYFHFLRSGDAGPLAAVMQHNQLDLLSLAALAARLFELIDSGPEHAVEAREAFALGHLYARGGLDRSARASYERAVALSRASPSVQVPALRALALMERRARRYEAAAAWWRRALELPRCPPRVAREAAEALAIHAEHRRRDFAAARSFALQSLDEHAHRSWNEAVRHRLGRLDRKLDRAGAWRTPLLD